MDKNRKDNLQIVRDRGNNIKREPVDGIKVETEDTRTG